MLRHKEVEIGLSDCNVSVFTDLALPGRLEEISLFVFLTAVALLDLC